MHLVGIKVDNMYTRLKTFSSLKTDVRLYHEYVCRPLDAVFENLLKYKKIILTGSQ